jgi:dual oxidase
LTLIVIIMYVFATPYARRNAFNAFWNTHSLYIFLYIFMIMHGLGRLVQAPITHTYLIGPLFVFIIDKLISLSRKKIECRVVKAELLPSGTLTSYAQISELLKLVN